MVDVSDDRPPPSFALVHGDQDLWAHVLSLLPLSALYDCASTSQFHRSLMRLSRAHVDSLSVSMECGITAPTASYGNDSARPKLVVEELSGSRTAVDRILLPPLPGRSTREAGTTVHHRHLLLICSCYPKLTRLHLDVSPTPTNDEQAVESVSGVERLIDVVSWFSRSAIQLKSDKRIGPLPWCLLGTPTVEVLTLTATFAGALQPDPEENDETCYRIRPLMSMCGPSCGPSLRDLDLTGVGPGVVSVLVHQALPKLRILRMGQTSNRHSFGWSYERGVLGQLGRAFPTLTALDVGYASFVGGVTFADVDELLTACKGLQHLDLSMVMTYVDFGPALSILAKKAPDLRSLATHGLSLPTPRLLELAARCPHLERAHFVAWKGSQPSWSEPGSDTVPADECLAVLRAFTNLVHLDISCGAVPPAQLLTWLTEREASGKPVQSLIIHDCLLFGEDGRELTGPSLEEDMSRLNAFKASALAVCPSLVVSTSVLAHCEWDRGANDLLVEHRVPIDWLALRKRLLHAIWPSSTRGVQTAPEVAFAGAPTESSTQLEAADSTPTQ